MSEKLRILFTGDSITDASRVEMVRSMQEMFARMPPPAPQGGGAPAGPMSMDAFTNSILGTGYPLLVASQLGAEAPGKYEVLNRGISGHRVVDLDARVKRDCINLRPDVLSIMIGINDVWHECIDHNGVDAVKFERVYDAMLAETLAALPGLKLVLIEPYVLNGRATEANWDYFRDETELRRQTTVRLAEKYHALLLPAQKLFSEAAERTCVTDWTRDGVHPPPAGHWMLAQAWLELCRGLL